MLQAVGRDKMTDCNALKLVFRLMFQNIVLADTTGSLTTANPLSCAQKCVEPCVSFFYNIDTKQCLLSDQPYGKAHPGLKAEASWKYFQDAEASASCYPGYRDVTSVGMCVRFVTEGKRYSEATTDCEGPVNGRVVHLDTDAKIQAIDAIHRSEYAGTGFYIGLNDEPTYPRGDFRWTDGTPVTDNNWYPGQPDNNLNDNCIVIAPWRELQWIDLYCSDVIPYICEIVI